MNINQLSESRYLKQADVGPGMILTVRALEQENVAMEGQPVENKWILYFTEEHKGLVLNAVNAQLAAQALGSDETDDWIGKKLVLYQDRTITYGGKLVGGIRVRAPRLAPAKPPAHRPGPAQREIMARNAAQPMRVVEPEPAPAPVDGEPTEEDVPF